MGFVFILRGAAQRGRANKLAKALQSRGLGVCVGLQNEPAEVRASISRCLVDHCGVMAALWTEPDLADATFLEPMRYAMARGKLLAVSLDGTSLPAKLGLAAETAPGWPRGDAALSSLCEVIAGKASQASRPNEWAAATAFTAPEEYAAYNRMHKQGSAEAMVRFLHEFPGGMFEDIVRAELDVATSPSYKLGATRGPGLIDFGWLQGRERPGQVWRMGTSSPWRALRGLDRRWLWAGAASLGAAILALSAVQFAPSLQGRHDEFADAGTGRNIVQTPAPSIELAPAEAQAEPIAPGSVADPPGLPYRQPTAGSLRATLMSGEAIEATQSPRLVDAPSETAQPSENQLRSRLTGPIPETNARPPEASQPPAVPYDVAQLESEIRDFLVRARRYEARAIAAARRRAGIDNARSVSGRDSGGTGVYRGEWSDGAANGLGRAVWTNGDTFAGAWRASLPDGLGVLTFAGGLRYEGEFAAGAPTGRGVIWGADGRRLVGDRLFSALLSARAGQLR